MKNTLEEVYKLKRSLIETKYAPKLKELVDDKSGKWMMNPEVTSIVEARDKELKTVESWYKRELSQEHVEHQKKAGVVSALIGVAVLVLVLLMLR